MIKIGLIVNPIAGMGGKVGLKGTDGEMYKRALELGAKPVTSIRIEEVLGLVKRDDLYFFAAPGKMGEDHLKNFDFKFETIGKVNKETDSKDTKRIIRTMIEKEIKILIFVGGDGTARDVLDVVGMDVPVIAIPSGVKMFSSAFVYSTHAAAEMINGFGEDFIEKERSYR
jgi:predicted polyphosphate/ATP-dependent NAD kinase